MPAERASRVPPPPAPRLQLGAGTTRPVVEASGVGAAATGEHGIESPARTSQGPLSATWLATTRTTERSPVRTAGRVGAPASRSNRAKASTQASRPAPV